MSTPAPLRVALTGTGYAGATLHAPLIDATPGLQLCAVLSRQDAAEVARRLGPLRAPLTVHADLDSLLREQRPDLVVVVSPNDQHVRQASAALQAGAHVVIDKPLALSAAEAAPLTALARVQDRRVSVFHNRRWDGDFLTARALLRQRRLGRVRWGQLTFDRFRPQVRARWREGDGPGAGLWFDLGPHLLDQAVQLFGWPQRLRCERMRLRHGARADDAFECTLAWADGRHMQLSASMLAAQPRPRFALHGDHGSWIKHGLDPQEDWLKAGGRPDRLTAGQRWGADPQAGTLCLADAAGQPAAPRAWPTQDGRWPDYWLALTAALRGHGPLPVPLDEALGVQRLLDLGTASAAQDARWLPCTAPA
jgi:predicted dehydrogenase